MFTKFQVLDRIEQAQTDTPYCKTCGQPTTIAERDDVLWIECSTLSEPRSPWQSLRRFDFPSFHLRRQVVEAGVAA